MQSVHRRYVLGGMVGIGAMAAGIAFADGPGAVRALYQGWVHTGAVSGAVAALGRSGAPPEFIAEGRTALAEGAPMSPDTFFRIYSMTKPLTAMTALSLIEQGQLGLDQEIAYFLPAFRDMEVFVPGDRWATRRAAARITVRHLLTHTSGLIYPFDDDAYAPLSDLYMKAGLRAGLRYTIPVRDDDGAEPTSLSEFAARLARIPLAHDPGSKWTYGVSCDLLGAVIERASGVSFEHAMRARILNPLRMGDTAWRLEPGDAPRLAALYHAAPEGLTLLDSGVSSAWMTAPPFPPGGAGLISTARDYAKFCRMLARAGEGPGHRVLRPETVRLAHSNLLPPGVTFESGEDDFGAAMLITASRHADPPQPAGAFGWSGAAGTHMWVDPRTGDYFVHMLQRRPYSQEMIDTAGRAGAADLAVA